ncbi:MAG: hypothetical protein NT015_01620 [Alphaproteobacteria bacterium]|nr:hypothetical protein [Alphaproteobacteria bacterium]
MTDPEPPEKDFIKKHPFLVLLLLTPVALFVWLLVTLNNLFAFVH